MILSLLDFGQKIFYIGRQVTIGAYIRRFDVDDILFYVMLGRTSTNALIIFAL